MPTPGQAPLPLPRRATPLRTVPLTRSSTYRPPPTTAAVAGDAGGVVGSAVRVG